MAVIDGKTGEPATAEPHGPALRLLGFGGCELRMQHTMASYTVAAGRRLLQNSDWTGVIPPMVTVAASVGLTETDARQAIGMVGRAKWPPATAGYWWRNAVDAYAKDYGDQVRPCACCADVGVITARSVQHTAADCPSWHMLWTWSLQMCADAKAPIPPTVTRAQWFLFGAGINDGTRKTAVQMSIWGAGLQAIRTCTHNLVQDGVCVLPRTAVTIAKHHVLHAARTDYWWIKNKDEWITGGGTAATGRVETRAAWAAKWSGLVRLTPAGLDGIAAVRSSALT